MKPQTGRLGLYIHIPFCRSKCLYCDFCSFPHRDEETKAAYVQALQADLVAKSRLCTDYTVDTVYFGGGTPTVLSGDQLSALLQTVHTHYRVEGGAEISAECNPVTESLALFRQMRKSGFNRLSIGLQSIHDQELKALGRTHRYADFLSTLEDARCAGFENLSADLMFGIPHQTAERFLATLESVSSLGLEHLSAYSLTVEEGTPFFRMQDRLELPDEDTVADLYEKMIPFLKDRGFCQYEISNFSKPGYESKHNIKYWKCDPYLGFGPGAHSYFAGERFGNSRDIVAYIQGQDITEERHFLSAKEALNEYIMLRMRLSDGIERAAFAKRFDGDFEKLVREPFAHYQRDGLVCASEDRVRFTPRGFAVSNAILAEVLDFSN